MTNKNAKDKFAVGYIAVVLLVVIIDIVAIFVSERYETDVEEIFITALKIPAFIAYIIMMISGAREKKLIPINIGFIGVAGLVFVIISQSELSMIGNGLFLLAFGAVFLSINFKISKAKQKTPAIENKGEVQYDEK
jgi:peptidoglycan/LPS O-acetylase OafA/YrhL